MWSANPKMKRKQSPSISDLGEVQVAAFLNQVQSDFITRCSNDYSCAAMDQSVWSEMPEELMVRILTRLPALSLLSFKSVCKKWHAIISSPPFWEMTSEAPSQKLPVLLPYLTERLTIYNPLSKKWHKLAFNDCKLRGRSCYRGVAGYYTAWAGGLICMCVRYTGVREVDGAIHYTVDSHVWVWNPVTNRSLELSSNPSLGNPHLVDIIVYNKPFRYKVFLLMSSSIDIFDSLSRTWSTVKEESNSDCVSSMWDKLRVDAEPYPDSIDFIELRLDVSP